MEEWIKKSDVLEMLSLPTDILAEYICELKGVWVDEDWSNDKWISCSEELPKCFLVRDIFKRPQSYMSDVVLVTVKSEECDGIHYYVATDYMTGRTQDDVHWVMSCGYGGSAVYNQEIIAWMPKPDPYKE